MGAVIAINRRSWSISITTHFFGRENESGRARADLVGYVQAARPAGTFELVRTLHIDLTAGRDRLYADLGKSTRNQVNRAIREDALAFRPVVRPGERDLAEFQDFYNEFARAKGTSLCGPYHMQTLRLLARQHALALTSVSDATGAVLCRHAYIVDGRRATLLYSGSHFRRTEDAAERKRIARANRYLHWQDILLFKKRGRVTYDCGGLTADPRIAEFKRSFGGCEVSEYTGYVPLTWKGTLALSFRAFAFRLGRLVFGAPECA